MAAGGSILLLLLALCAFAGSKIAAADQPAAPSPWPGTEWAACDPSEDWRPRDACPLKDTGRRLLSDISCERVEWSGGAIGGGLGCTTTCTCFRRLDGGSRAPCAATVCPGDRVCKEGYVFLGVGGGRAMVDAPKGGNNCWRMKKTR